MNIVPEALRVRVTVLGLPNLEDEGIAVLLRLGLHVRVNFHEPYREHLATTFRRESKSWLAGFLRSLLRAPELRDLSEYEVSVYT